MSEIFEFQSLLRFPYFTHAACVECAVLLHIQWWDQSLSIRPGSGENKRAVQFMQPEEMQYSLFVAAGTFYTRRVSVQWWWCFHLMPFGALYNAPTEVQWSTEKDRVVANLKTELVNPEKIRIYLVKKCLVTLIPIVILKWQVIMTVFSTRWCKAPWLIIAIVIMITVIVQFVILQTLSQL